MNTPGWGVLLFMVINSWNILLLCVIHLHAKRTEGEFRLLRTEVRSNYHRGSRNA